MTENGRLDLGAGGGGMHGGAEGGNGIRCGVGNKDLGGICGGATGVGTFGVGMFGLGIIGVGVFGIGCGLPIICSGILFVGCNRLRCTKKNTIIVIMRIMKSRARIGAII